jgi:hypothetical protein
MGNGATSMDPKLDKEVDRLADSDREWAKECCDECLWLDEEKIIEGEQDAT